MSSASNSLMIASSASGPFSPFSALIAAPRMIGDVVARELVLRQQLAHLHLDQIQQLRVVDHVALVQEHHDVGNADLARQQDVLARLRHRAVDRRHHQDRAVHLRRARDHVLHVVGVARGSRRARSGGSSVEYSTWLVAIVRIFVGIAAALALRGLRNLVVGRPPSASSPGPPKPSSAPPSASSCRGRRDRSCRRCSAASSDRILPWPLSALLALALRSGRTRCRRRSLHLAQAYFALTSSATLRGTSA